MSDIMKMGKSPNYLGSWDLDELPNQEVTLTIAKIVDEDVVANNREERCTVCYWTDKAYKPMILNVTNKKTLAKLFRTKNTEQMVGKSVVVGIDKVKAFGDVHDALRIRKRIPKVEAAVQCADCGGDIQGAYGKGPEYIAMYTKKQYGVSLCSACATARAEKAEQQKDGVDDGQTEIEC